MFSNAERSRLRGEIMMRRKRIAQAASLNERHVSRREAMSSRLRQSSSRTAKRTSVGSDANPSLTRAALKGWMRLGIFADNVQLFRLQCLCLCVVAAASVKQVCLTPHCVECRVWHLLMLLFSLYSQTLLRNSLLCICHGQFEFKLSRSPRVCTNVFVS